MKERWIVVWNALTGKTPREFEDFRNIQADHERRINHLEKNKDIHSVLAEIGERLGK